MKIKPLLLKGNKVLTFDQSSAFYTRVAQRYADQNALTQALQFYWRAMLNEPQNPNHQLDVARTLNEMGRFEQSNAFLMPLSRRENKLRGECYFLIGSNLMGMQEYERARDALHRALQADPLADYVDDAEEMLFWIHEEVEAYYEEENCSPQAQELAEQGKHALDAGDYKRAVRLLERALALAPNLSYAQNNLALSCFLEGDAERGLQVVRALLKQEPQNIHALCNLILFSEPKTDNEEVQAALDVLRACKAEAPDEAYKAALTFCEVGDQAHALAWLEQSLHFDPFDLRTLYLAGACAYNTGRLHAAYRYFETMHQADPDDSIGAYYRGVCKQAQQGMDVPHTIALQMQVPLEEAVRRVKYLNGAVAMETEELGRLWREDGQFRCMVVWALHLRDSGIQRAMLELLSMLGDGNAEQVLRLFLMEEDVSYAMKNDTFPLLKRMGAQEPYVALLNGELVEARVTVVDTDDQEVPECYPRVIELVIRRMRLRKRDAAIESAVKLWTEYIRHCPRPLPEIPRIAPWAAALEILACEQQGLSADLKDVADAYRTHEANVEPCVQQLRCAHQQQNGAADPPAVEEETKPADD